MCWFELNIKVVDDRAPGVLEAFSDSYWLGAALVPGLMLTALRNSLRDHPYTTALRNPCKGERKAWEEETSR